MREIKKEDKVEKLNDVEFLNIDGGKDKLIINPERITAVLLTTMYNQDKKRVVIHTDNSYQPLEVNCGTDKDAEEVFEKLRLVLKLI